MAKRKLLRIREKTYERLGQVADDEELSISELADRVLSSYLENLEEEDNEEEDEENYEDDDSEEDDEDIEDEDETEDDEKDTYDD